MPLRAATLTLPPHPRGVHLVHGALLDGVRAAGMPLDATAAGLLHLHLLHTSAGLFLTENASPDVRRDLDAWMRDVVPDGWPGFRHTLEGPDDMPAHVGSALVGVQLALPVEDGRLVLGRWQGIALAEFREDGGARRVRATLQH